MTLMFISFPMMQTGTVHMAPKLMMCVGFSFDRICRIVKNYWQNRRRKRRLLRLTRGRV